jgi:prevent-host-death family protein
MMPTIGVRELRERTAEVIRQVREDKQEFMITLQGHPVAILLPVDTEAVEKKMIEASKRSALDPWEMYEKIANELRRKSPTGLTTQEIMDEIRR